MSECSVAGLSEAQHGEEGTDASDSRICQHCHGLIGANIRPHAKFCSARCRRDFSAAKKNAESIRGIDPDDDDDAAPEGTQRSSRRLEYLAAAAVMATALALLCLSLTHLASGVAILTGSDAWSGWAMAVGVDAGFIVLEIAVLVASDSVRAEVERWANPTIIGSLMASAAMNGFSFARQADGWMLWPAIGLGVAIPMMILALVKVGSTLFYGEKH